MFFFGLLVLRVVGHLVVDLVTGFLVVKEFIFTLVMLPVGAITRIFTGNGRPEPFLSNPLSNLGIAVVDVKQPPFDRPKVEDGVIVTLDDDSVDVRSVGKGLVVEIDDTGKARVVEKASEVRGGKVTVVGVESRKVTSEIPGPEGEDGGKDWID